MNMSPDDDISPDSGSWNMVSTVVTGIALVLLALLPWMFRFIPLLDYPNWLVEAHIIGKLFSGTGAYDALWELNWTPTPNILIPTIMGFLAQYMPVEIVGKFMLTLYFVLFPLGLLLLGKANRAGGVSGFTLVAFWVFNSAFFWGYISYVISLVFVWFTILFLHSLTNRSHRFNFLLFAGLSTLTYFTHLMGYVVVLTLVGSFSLICWIEKKRTIQWYMPAFAQIFPLFALVSYTIARLEEKDVSSSTVFYTSLLNKLSSFFEPFLVAMRLSPAYEFPYTTVVNLLVFGLVSFLVLFRRKTIRWSYLSLAGSILVFVAVVLPVSWFAGMIKPDARLIFPGVLLILGTITLNVSVERLRLLTASILIGLTVLTLFRFSAVQSSFAAIDALSSDFIAREKSVTIVAIRRPPIYSQCSQNMGNIWSMGTFPVLRIPFHSAIKSGKAIHLPLFSSGLVRVKEEIATQQDTQAVTIIPVYSVEDVHSLSPELLDFRINATNGVIVMGCPQDVDQLHTYVNPSIMQSRLGEQLAFVRVYQSENLSFPFISKTLIKKR